LVTNTATDFFASKLGFVPVDLHSVDDSIRKMPNFQASAGLEGAVCMRAELPLDEGVR
jgi:N-acetylglutamate synthase-like GNAT family acetyltransferase